LVEVEVSHNFNILLAEDVADERRLFELALKRIGHKQIHVSEVEYGTEVIEYLEGEGKYSNRARFPFPDLLITDLNMPRMDGLEVLRWVRGHPEFSGLPVVMLSASGRDKEVRKAYRLGVNAYFQKPTSFFEFIPLLSLIIDHWMAAERVVVGVDTPFPARVSPHIASHR
jgi:CheY-like chemotaxis protein